LHGEITFLWVNAIFYCAYGNLSRVTLIYVWLYAVDKDRLGLGVTRDGFDTA